MQNDEMENGPIEHNGRKWQFWFLVTFSLLLVVTFIFYLPARFERNFLRGEDHMMEEMPSTDGEMHDGAMGSGGHGGVRYHEESAVKEGLAVNLNVTPAPVLAGSSTQLDFFVNEKPNNLPVPFSQIEINHTKLMHVIGVRSDLNEFFHIHPAPTPQEGVFSVQHIFTKPGSYKLWSEVKKEGVTHAFGHPIIDVKGEGERQQKEVSFTRNVSVGSYQVILRMQEPVAKSHEHALSFDIHTLGGTEVDVENFLGVPMHLAVIKDDLTQFIHTHPEEGDHHGFQLIQEVWANGAPPAPPDVMAPRDAAEDEAVNFRVTFPEAGLYKVFAQFRPLGIGLPADEALTASFWIEVKEKQTLSAASSWWILLIAAVSAIIVLSILVHKFITIKK